MPACRYFDGLSSRPHDASAGAEGAALRVVGDGIDRTIAAGDLRFAPAIDGGPARVTFASGGLCEFDDRSAANALFDALGHRPSRVDRLSARPLQVVSITVAFVAVMTALYVWGVPIAADALVDRVPTGWDRALGNRVLGALDAQRFLKPTKLAKERRDEILDRFNGLRLPIDHTDQARSQLLIEFRSLGAPNAFALPGEIIVLTDEIVDLADGDDGNGKDAALLTVMGHEVGHVDHRDTMRQLVRSTLTSMVAAWYFGDVSNVAAVVVGGIGSFRYSRAAEREADRYALEAMRENGIPTIAAAALFRRLEEWQPVRDSKDSKEAPKKSRRQPIPEYLSTHPATEDRIKLFEEGSLPASDRPR